MIDRYRLPAMERVWSDAHRLELWLDVELAVTAVREIPARDLYVRPQSPAVAVTEPELAPVELRAAA